MPKLTRVKKVVILFLVMLLLGIASWRSILRSPRTEPLTWEKCVGLLGSIVQESYPGRCITADGRTVVQPISEEDKYNLKPSEETTPTDYYGQSTYAACDADSDCKISGCNGEICQEKNEEALNSICLLPNKPTPEKLGMWCRCLSYRC